LSQPSPQHDTVRIAAIVPCHRVSRQIMGLLAAIGPEVKRIYVVDDCCPEGTASLVEASTSDPRVVVIRHAENRGVGGAVLSGYRAALADGMEVLVKLDGDGQMDPALVPRLVAPILAHKADYTKGNRFFEPESLASMPWVRLVGNAVLSFMNKLSSGYWDLFDPTNGFTAIHHVVAARLNHAKLSQRYFFESDMLFRLNLMKAVVQDVPMAARYGNESSGLRVSRVVPEFAWKHLRNFSKRIVYNYYLRDVSLASLELPVGLALLAFGGCFGAYHWHLSEQRQVFASAGTVLLSAMPILAGLQFLLAFLAADIASLPRIPLVRRLGQGEPHD
jgi:glycosyltransferase involved in cell wall biosynthesis